MKLRGLLVVLLSPIAGFGQIAFFNMPNPDMLPAVGYAYAELDQYQSLKGNRSVNATVARLSVQPAKFLEVGANFWFNEDSPGDPNRTVLATKWKIDLYQKHPITVTFSPGSWTSIYYDPEIPIKNLLYGFLGLNHEEGPKSYTRLMLGGYARYQSGSPDQYGIIAGFEHRFSDKLEFVTDYFQGTGEGFGLATGIVFYAAEKGHNLPIYLAYQFDNEGSQNDVLIVQVGWFFNMFGKRATPGSSPGARSTKLERSFLGGASSRTTP